jgi:RNA polymerase sigma-70 factor, ECF subfamily
MARPVAREPRGDAEPGPAVGGRLEFEDFFQANHLSLFRALWLVTRNRHEAEEIMQDAFLRLWERWDRVASMADPAGYLYRTAMNVLRSRARRARVAVRLALGHRPEDDGMAAVEARDALVRGMGALTEGQRAAIVLTDLLGYQSEQAADVLGVRPSTIRVQAARARAALKKELSETDG